MRKRYEASGINANLLTLPIFIIATGFLMGLVWLLGGWETMIDKAFTRTVDNRWLLIGLLLVFIPIHELIHGICFARYTPNGWKDIRFGFMWKALAPYCNCKGEVLMKGYRIALYSPTVIGGVISLVYALIVQEFWTVILFGIIISAGAGDFMIVYLGRKLSGEVKVKDGEDFIGFEVVE